MILNKLTHPIQRLPCGGKILKHHGELVCIQCLIRISDIPVEHIEQAVVFHDDNAVALGVSFGLDIIDAVSYLLAFREVIIGSVRKFHRDNVGDTLQLTGVQFLLIDIDLCVGEGA